jgi:hypothetical protein
MGAIVRTHKPVGRHTAVEQPSRGDPPPQPERQASTCWSVIVRAQGCGAEARQALDQLIRRYERTVMTIIGTVGHPWNRSAEDLKQEFFTRVIERSDIRKLDKERGKFRNWLHVAVRYFVYNEWNKWKAQYTGNRVTAPMAFDAVHYATPESLAMRQFAEETLLHALARHRDRATNPHRFDQLVRFLPGPRLDFEALAPVADGLGISANALAVHLADLKAKHRRILREVVAETLDIDPATAEGERALDLEMRELYALLRDVPRVDVIVEDA